MASKKYLDQGGVSHLWDKIKSWISSYLVTSNISDLNSYMDDWKATNFGSGSYTVSSSSSLSIRNDSSVTLNRESQIDLDDDKFVIKGSGEIRVASNRFTITRRFGIALLFNSRADGQEMNTDITNDSGEELRVIAISVTSKAGTALRVQNKTVGAYYTGSYTLSIPLTHGVPTLIMWCST